MKLFSCQSMHYSVIDTSFTDFLLTIGNTTFCNFIRWQEGGEVFEGH